MTSDQSIFTCLIIIFAFFGFFPVLYLQRRKSIQDQVLTVIAYLGICSLIEVAMLVVTPQRFDWNDLPALKEAGNAIISQLEDFKAEHGRYPNSLQEAGIEPEKTRYGPWKYEYISEKEYHLILGDYMRNHFELKRKPSDEDW
jgi:hypothetical protein